MDSILDLNLNDPELQPKNIPTGEQKLRITKIEAVKNKETGYDQLKVSINLDEGGNYWPIAQYLPLFHDDPDKMLTYRRMIADFCAAWEIPVKKNGSVNINDFVGKTVWAIVKTEEYEGREKSVIDKYSKSVR